MLCYDIWEGTLNDRIAVPSIRSAVAKLLKRDPKVGVVSRTCIMFRFVPLQIRRCSQIKKLPQLHTRTPIHMQEKPSPHHQHPQKHLQISLKSAGKLLASRRKTTSRGFINRSRPLRHFQGIKWRSKRRNSPRML